MNVPLVIAGSIAILGAAIHGVGGEIFVVRKLSPSTLPSSPFGGPRMTLAMIHATWHMTTVAFLAVGTVLLLSGTALDGETPEAILVVAAVAATAFAAIALAAGGAHNRSPRLLLRHPGPAVLLSAAVLAWWGAL